MSCFQECNEEFKHVIYLVFKALLCREPLNRIHNCQLQMLASFQTQKLKLKSHLFNYKTKFLLKFYFQVIHLSLNISMKIQYWCFRINDFKKIWSNYQKTHTHIIFDQCFPFFPKLLFYLVNRQVGRLTYLAIYT